MITLTGSGRSHILLVLCLCLGGLLSALLSGILGLSAPVLLGSDAENGSLFEQGDFDDELALLAYCCMAGAWLFILKPGQTSLEYQNTRPAPILQPPQR